MSHDPAELPDLDRPPPGFAPEPSRPVDDFDFAQRLCTIPCAALVFLSMTSAFLGINGGIGLTLLALALTCPPALAPVATRPQRLALTLGALACCFAVVFAVE